MDPSTAGTRVQSPFIGLGPFEMRMTSHTCSGATSRLTSAGEQRVDPAAELLPGGQGRHGEREVLPGLALKVLLGHKEHAMPSAESVIPAGQMHFTMDEDPCGAIAPAGQGRHAAAKEE